MKEREKREMSREGKKRRIRRRQMGILRSPLKAGFQGHCRRRGQSGDWDH